MWVCCHRCDEALETASVVKTGEVVNFDLEGKQLVGQRFMVWEALSKTVDKYYVILSMVMKIGSPCEEWRALVKIVA